MNKQSIRAFGIAVFLVGALIYSMNTLGIALPGMGVPDAAAQKEIASLEEQLEKANEQLTKQEEPAKTTTKQQAATAKEEQADESDGTSEDIDVTLTIYRGITSYDISRKLEDAGIIDNALEFELFLANGGYSKRLQIGEFTITSDMDDEEIAALITTPQ